jgi:serine/threonine protein kinase
MHSKHCDVRSSACRYCDYSNLILFFIYFIGWAKKHGIKLESGAIKSSRSNPKLDRAAPSTPTLIPSRSGNLTDGLRRVLRPINSQLEQDPETRANLDAVRRHNIMIELAETEANYVKTIKEILESFAEPLQKLSNDPSTALLSPIEVKLIFSGELPTLLRLHTNIVTALRQRLKAWDPETKCSDVFHAIPSHGFCYKNYTSNYDTALDTLKKIITSGIVTNKSPQVVATNDAGIPLESDVAAEMLDPYFQPTASKFLDWLHSRMLRRSHRTSVGQISSSLGSGSGIISVGGGLSGSGGQLTAQGSSNFVGASMTVNRMDTVAEFLHLLMSPLQRIGHYTSLLRSYISVTPPDHPDYHDISSLYEQLVRVGESVLEVKVLAETRVKIVQITDSLSGYTESLFRSDREFLREGAVSFKPITNPASNSIASKIAGGKSVTPIPGQLFLFNDLLLWAKRMPADKQTRTLAFVRSVLLKNVSGVANADSLESGGRCAFEVVTNNGAESFVFYADNEEQRQSWVSAISAATSRAASHVMWIKVRPKGTYPSPRGSHTVVVLKNSLYLFGGHYFNTYYNDLYVFTIEKQQWTKLTSTEEGPSPRTEHASASVDSQRFFMFGGFNGKTRLNDLWVFDSSENSWLKIEPQSQSVPRERSGHKLIRCHGALYLFGGIDSTGTYLNDLWKLTISSDGRAIWQVIPYNPGEKVPEARAFHSMNNVGGRIVIFGGYSFKKCFDDLFVFDIDGRNWVNPTEISPTVSQQQTSSDDGTLGVESDSILAPGNAASSLSQSGNSLSDANPVDVRPSARSRHSVFAFGDALFFHGGNSYSGSSYLCDFWALRKVGGASWGVAPVQWTKLALPLQLDSRYGHSISGPLLYKKSNKSVAVMFGGISGLLTQYTFWNDVTIFKNLSDLVGLAGGDKETKDTAPRLSDAVSTEAITQANPKMKPRHSPSFSGFQLKSDAANAAVRNRAASVAVSKSNVAGRIRAMSIKSGSNPAMVPSVDFMNDDVSIEEELAKPSGVDRYTGKGLLPLTIETVLSDPVFIDRCYVESSISIPPPGAPTAPVGTATDLEPPEVYRAVYGSSVSPKAPSVVLKIWRNVKLNERMKAEMSIMRVARHTNLVPYYAMAERESDMWLAQGSCLTNVMQMAYTIGHTYSERQIAIIAKSVLCALNFLHSCDIVARCVRPENIMINDKGLIQLSDWGLYDLLAASRDAQQSGSAASTSKSKSERPSAQQVQRQFFMAPELKRASAAKTAELECRADIWSLGISLIYLCEPTQKDYMIPGKATEGMESVRAILTRSNSTLIKLNMFRDFIGHCLAPSPENRSDAASLLKHPFIVENTAEFDKLAVESADTYACDAAEEMSPFIPLTQQYQAVRRSRSVDTAQLSFRRETYTFLVADGDDIPPPNATLPRKRSNSTGSSIRSVSPGRKEKRIRQGSNGSAPGSDDEKPVKKRTSDRRHKAAVSSSKEQSTSSDSRSGSIVLATPPETPKDTPTKDSSRETISQPAKEQLRLSTSSSTESDVASLQEKLADKESEVEKLKQELAAEKARLEAEKSEMARQLRAQIEAEMRAEMLKQQQEAQIPASPKQIVPLSRVGRSNSKVFEKIALFETVAEKAAEASLSRKSSSGSTSSSK